MNNITFSCRQFYQNKTLFITGTTGFVAKVLLEKILRCLDIRLVYVLIRGKKGGVIERFEKEILNSKCFDRLRHSKGAEYESFMRSKVIPVQGDLLLKQLGIEGQEREKLCSEVQIIINSAASVDFNSPIRTALDINYFGCQKVLDFAKECTKLENFCHISTAYVNCDKFGFLEERIYNPEDDVQSYVQTIYRNCFTEDQQKILLGKFPNTYTFTKNLAEQMLYQQKPKDMQITIIRPTIVGCALKEPFPGWIDNLVGGAAVMFFAGIGMITIFKADERLISDQVPVDFVADQTLVATAFEANNQSFQIYHCGTSARNPGLWRDTKDAVLEYWNKFPPTQKVGPCSFVINDSLIYYRIANFMRKIPAKAFQVFAELRGDKEKQKLATRYLKIIDKADLINKTFKHFNRNEWIYSQENTLLLMKSITQDEMNVFQLDVTVIDWKYYLTLFQYGLQKYIMNEQVQEPVPNEDMELMRSWKSNNFQDVQYILNPKI